MPIDQVIALSSHVEKLGIVGVLVVACCVIGYGLKYYRGELLTLHVKFDKLKTAFIIVKNAADTAGVKYDLSAARDLDDLIGDK